MFAAFGIAFTRAVNRSQSDPIELLGPVRILAGVFDVCLLGIIEPCPDSIVWSVKVAVVRHGRPGLFRELLELLFVRQCSYHSRF